MNPVFIAGFGRSGTTWLGNIFDSSPATRYIHEPDKLSQPADIPGIILPDQQAAYEDALKNHMAQMLATRSVATLNNKKQFRKCYRSPFAETLHKSCLTAALFLHHISKAHLVPSVPDFTSGSMIPVIKSVSATGRFAALAQIFPNYRFIFLLRHPGAIHASLQRGMRLGKMAPLELYDDQLTLPFAVKKGLNPQQRNKLSDLEKTAWSWAIINDYVLAHTASLANVKILQYEELCQDPIGITQNLFEFCGIKWQQQTHDFLSENLQTTETAHSYHAVVRNPATTMDKWRGELTEAEVLQIESIAADSAAGTLYEFKA